MKNNEDYIYEYSDLNLFQTRVKILTGIYEGMILEFGSSVLSRWHEENAGDKNNFTFDYTVYKWPENSKDKLKETKELNDYLCELLINIISDRRKDKEEHSKLMEAASRTGARNSKIKIAGKWYNKR